MTALNVVLAIVLLWIVPTMVAISQGRAKNRPGYAYGILFSWLGVLMLAVLPPLKPHTGVATHRECPFCKEPMRHDATVCPHCRHESKLEIEGRPLGTISSPVPRGWENGPYRSADEPEDSAASPVKGG